MTRCMALTALATAMALSSSCYLMDETEDMVGSQAAPLIQTVLLPGYKSNWGNPDSWWHDTGVDMATVYYRVRFDCLGGAIMPWPGHTGFSCAGDTTHYWSESLAPNCPFGSLIARVGNGTPFCVGTNTGWFYPGRTGQLYIAFNDGVNFQDNSGSWSVEVNHVLDAPRIKMPFVGYIDKNSLAQPGSHQLFESNGITQWSTDIFPSGGPGTTVVFGITPGITGQVVENQDSCPGVAAGGKTVIVDLKENGTRIGRAMYSHLGGETPAKWKVLNDQSELGQTIAVPGSPIWGCYEVSNVQDTHIHFELGTDTSLGVNNKSCWTKYSPNAVRQMTWKVGQFGKTGYSSIQQCP